MANDIPISDREREILRLVATGATNQQIAQQLSISINTVKGHLRNIFGKIGVVSRTEATIYAISNGLVMVDIGDTTSPAALLGPLDDQPDEPAQLVDAAEPAADAAEPEPPPLARPSPRRRPLLIVIGTGLALLVVLAIAVQIAGRPAAPPSAGVPDPPTAVPAASDAGQRWAARSPLLHPRDDVAVTAYDQERKLYVIGGQLDGTPSAAVDRYDPESNLWVSLTDKPHAVSHAGAIVLRGKIYVPGGELANGKVTAMLETYDPRQRRWDMAAPLPAGRSRYALVATEGQFYLIGGWDGAQARAEVFIYDPERDSWGEGPSLPSPQQGAGAAVVSDRIFVVGGVGTGGPLRESIRLDPSAQGRGWDVMAPLPQPIARPGATAVINTLLVFDAAAHAGWQYDQTADAWEPIEIPSSAEISPGMTLLESSIYFVSGRSAAVSGGLTEYRVIYTTFVPARTR
ncbi:MAG: LuxR C-terminal-related transcriptional regulator [Chloroflexales bacterium]